MELRPFIITSYAELRAALADRRKTMGLKQLDVDHIAGLQSGYTGKLEAQVKNFGPMSFDAMLGALGLKIELSASKLAEHSFNSVYYRAKLKKERAALGAKGGRKAAASMTWEERRKRARKAGKASAAARKIKARLAKAVKGERERADKASKPAAIPANP
jgi:hypothetical protein